MGKVLIQSLAHVSIRRSKMSTNYKSDFEAILSRMKEAAKSEKTYIIPPAEVEETLKRYRDLTVTSPLRDDAYRFSDLDYTATHNELWPVGTVLGRVISMLRVMETAKGELYNEIFDLCVGHLTDIAFGKYKNDNWWQGDIGCPLSVKRVLMLCEDKLNPELRSALIHLMDRGSVKCRPEILTVKNAYHSGANLAWYCINSMHRAVLLNDPEEIMLIIEHLAKETVPGAYEGIQKDYSYFQHHRRIYTHGYGAGFAADFARMYALVSGTSFAFPTWARENIVNYILEGSRYLIGGGGIDYLCCGRNIARFMSYSASSWISTLKTLISCDGCPRIEELEQMLSDIQNNITPAKGTKFFPVAKYLTTRVNGLYISFRGTDPSLFQAECNRDENYLAINLSYGTSTCIMNRGDEYKLVFNLGDFSYIPGVSCRYETDTVLKNKAYSMKEGFSWYKVNTEDFGGDQKDDLAACFIGAKNYGVNAIVSAFATPDGMIILGSDLYEDNGLPIHTTVNQCNTSGSYTASESGKVIVHDKVAYINLDNKTAFRAAIVPKSYDYRRNYFEKAGTESHYEAELFTLDIPTEPSYGKYAYMITHESCAAKKAKILRNDSEIQGIQLEDGRIILVFHKAASITLDDGRTVSGSKCEVRFV